MVLVRPRADLPNRGGLLGSSPRKPVGACTRCKFKIAGSRELVAKEQQMIAAPLPRCTHEQTLILQLRARGASFREIAKATRISPRKVHDQYRAALSKVIAYLEQQSFLEPRA